MHINLYAPKGGQGVSTVAALVALGLDGRVLLVDAAGHHDLPAVLGTPVPTDWADTCGVCVGVTPDLGLLCAHPQLNLAAWDYDHVVVDCGTMDRPNPHGYWVMVVRNDFLAARRAGAPHREYGPNGLVVVAEPGRALTTGDLSAAIGAPVLETVNVDPAIARAVDAGLMVSRRPAVAGYLAEALRERHAHA